MLLSLDQDLFFFVNNDLSNSFLDWLTPILRNKYTWFPIYALVALVLVYRWKKVGLAILLFGGLTVLLTDFTSSSIIKPMVDRLRPCNDPDMVSHVNLVIENCGSGYSFTSSHAANHFGMALFFIWLWGRRFRWLVWAGLAWALAISFSQVYVGVHYPFDIFGGAVVGLLLSLLTWWLFSRFVRPRLIDDNS